MKRVLLVVVLVFLSVGCWADLASDLSDCIGYYIHSSYHLSGSITGGVNGKVLTLGPYTMKILDYAYIYTYYPTIVLLYNPDSKNIKLVIEDEIVDAMMVN